MDLQGQLLPSDLVWILGFRECGEGRERGAERRGRASGLEAGRAWSGLVLEQGCCAGSRPTPRGGPHRPGLDPLLRRTSTGFYGALRTHLLQNPGDTGWPRGESQSDWLESQIYL